jgi:hypothetical protein
MGVLAFLTCIRFPSGPSRIAITGHDVDRPTTPRHKLLATHTLTNEHAG